MFNYSKFYVSILTAKKLRNIFAMSVMQQYRYTEPVASNKISIHNTILVVLDIKDCNKEGIHRYSLNEDIIYVID